MGDSTQMASGPVSNAQARIRIVMALFTLIFSAIGVRLIMLGNESPPEKSLPAAPPSFARPDVTDRNGTPLAMDIPGVSIYAEHRRSLDAGEAIEGLTTVWGRNKNCSKLYAKVERSRNVMRHALVQPGGGAT